MTIDFSKIHTKLVNMFKNINNEGYDDELTFNQVMKCIQDGNTN